jgi:glycosyltransferase involved in cell wall biosynthesis
MIPLKVAIIADLLEESWPSMDLVADMLVERLRADYRGQVEPTLIRPPLRARASKLPLAGALPPALTIDRFANRLWDYPRATREASSRFDLFHIVDHSYAHLVHTLPAERTLVTCHDLDTFRSILEPEQEPRPALFRAMTRRILAGLRAAGHVACDTEATRDALIARAGVDPARTSVVLNGPHPSCSPAPEPAADVEAARLLGHASRTTDLLHVSSTIARKRIDVLLAIVAAVRKQRPDVRLVRVGGPFTADQRRLARELGIEEAIVVLPFLDRSTLAAVYRRCALVLLPSEREGFGLPVLEALACGTPIVASDIDALREVGGTAVDYCAPEDIDAWTSTVVRVLAERRDDPALWRARRTAGIERAASFSWSHYTADVVALYRRLAAAVPQTAAAR